MNKIKLAAFLVITGAGFFQSTAHAVFQGSTGDLFLGFESYGTNSPSGYVIDIGPESLYTTGNGSTFQINTAFYGGASSLNTELNSTFSGDIAVDGSYWGDTADTFWGVGGGTSGGSIYLGKAETTIGTQTSPIAAITPSNTTLINGDLANVLSAFNQTGSFVSGTQANVEAQNLANNWATYNTNAGQSFGSFGGKEGNINIPSANQGTVLDLYQNTAGSAGVYEGKFTINSTGLITYTTATSVPEPSAFAALAGGAGLLGLIRRRRAVVA